MDKVFFGGHIREGKVVPSCGRDEEMKRWTPAAFARIE